MTDIPMTDSTAEKKELICITCPIGCHLTVEVDTQGQKSSESHRASLAKDEQPADISGTIKVTGNRCARGEQYAREEISNPKRVVTFTCAARVSSVRSSGAPGVQCAPQSVAYNSTSLSLPRRVPVRTTAAFPKEKIPELIALLRTITVLCLSHVADIVVHNALGTGIDVIATRSISSIRSFSQ